MLRGMDFNAKLAVLYNAIRTSRPNGGVYYEFKQAFSKTQPSCGCTRIKALQLPNGNYLTLKSTHLQQTIGTAVIWRDNKHMCTFFWTNYGFKW